MKEAPSSFSLLHCPSCFIPNLITLLLDWVTLVTIRATHLLPHIQGERLGFQVSVSQREDAPSFIITLVQIGIGLPIPEPLIAIVKGTEERGLS